MLFRSLDLFRFGARRITDASTKPFAKDRLSQLGASYAPGDTDLAWTRLTHWREQLAAVLDQPPYEPVTGVEVIGAGSSPSTGLLAAWLRLELDVPMVWRYAPQDDWDHGIRSVRLTRPSGDILLERSTKQRIEVKSYDLSAEPQPSGKMLYKTIKIQNGIDREKAKKIMKAIKDMRLKVEPQIQDDQIRVSGKKFDDLQAVMAMCRSTDFEVPLQFENMKS